MLTQTVPGRDGGSPLKTTETILRNARVIAMDQKLDFTPGDKPDIAKTTVNLRPKVVSRFWSKCRPRICAPSGVTNR